MMFFEIGALKSFANFTGKQLCWSLCLNKLQCWRPATLSKRDSSTSDFSKICLIFKNICFYRTTPVAASGHSSSFLESKAYKKVFGSRANVFIIISHCFYACWNDFLVTAEGIFGNPDFLNYIRLSILRAADITNISILRTEVQFPLFCPNKSLINHFCITNICIANSRFYKPKKPRYNEFKTLNTGESKEKNILHHNFLV